MKKWILPSFVFILITGVAYVFTLWMAPRAVLAVLKSKGKTPLNSFFYADQLSGKERRVKLPNPDFLYSLAGYDLSNGPLKISGEMPDTSYYSLAIYEDNTRNFFILNDTQVPNNKFEIILTKKGEEAVWKEKYPRVIGSSSSIGVILVRELIDKQDSKRIEYLKVVQETLTIEVLN